MDGDGVCSEEGGLAAFFEMAQARVDDFFDAAEFGAPEITHVIEAAVDGIEAGIQVSCKHGRHNTEDGSVE